MCVPISLQEDDEEEEDYGTEYLVQQPVGRPEEATEGASDVEPGEGEDEDDDEDEFGDEEEEDVVEEVVKESTLIKGKRSREEDDGEKQGRPLKR
jgi:hypothetical protein